MLIYFAGFNFQKGKIIPQNFYQFKLCNNSDWNFAEIFCSCEIVTNLVRSSTQDIFPNLFVTCLVPKSQGFELQGTKLSGLELSVANYTLGLSCHENKCRVTFWCVWLCVRCTVVALHIGNIKWLFLLSSPSHWQKSFATSVWVIVYNF